MSLARRQPKTGASASPDLALPKGPTRAEQRAARVTPTCGRRRAATGLQKPQPGSQRRRAAVQEGLTKLKKTEAKVRDVFRCQYPGCTMQGRHNVDGAHVENSGMGGRPSVSSQRSDFVTLCNHNGPDGGHHRGNVSLHSTHLLVKPLSADGADGPLAWYRRPRVGNAWGAYRQVGISRPLTSSDRVPYTAGATRRTPSAG